MRQANALLGATDDYLTANEDAGDIEALQLLEQAAVEAGGTPMGSRHRDLGTLRPRLLRFMTGLCGNVQLG
jgi:hypothetical protein